MQHKDFESERDAREGNEEVTRKPINPPKEHVHAGFK